MALRTPLTEMRFELSTDWSGYQKILEVVGERPIHVTYDRGRLELLSPGRAHERGKTVLGALVECIMMETGIDFEPGGGMTFQREDLDRGFEPDECYWIAHWEAVHGKREWTPIVDPPPDLAIEAEITSSVINRLALYHAIGVGEVWRLTKTMQVLFLRREAESYRDVACSPTFPWLSAATLTEWMAKDLPQSRLVRSFRDELPRLRGNPAP